MITHSQSFQSIAFFVLIYTAFLQFVSLSTDGSPSLQKPSVTSKQIRQVTSKETLEFPKTEISPLLYIQALSHQSLHRPVLQQALASLGGTPKTVLIVGVEWGADLTNFAMAGYRVIAFEPMPLFHSRLGQTIDRNPSWNVQLYNMAAGNETSQMTIHYQHQMSDHPVKVVRIDDHVHEDVTVFSVDVQGSEFDVLQGAERLLKNSVKIIWFEAIGCNERVLSMMHYLKNDFVLFDFVPVGTPLNSKEKGWKRRENFLFEGSRPSSFSHYYHWLCDAKKRGFSMLQTDILAVHRSIVNEVWPELASLSNSVCRKEGSNCILRSLMHGHQK